MKEIESTLTKESLLFNHALLLHKEREEWRQTLGTAIDVKPLPKIITPEIHASLIKYGFSLYFMPEIKLFENIDLYRFDPKKDLYQDLHNQYPLWPDYQDEMQTRRFLDFVKNGNISLDISRNRWIAVENLKSQDASNAFLGLLNLEKEQTILDTEVLDLLVMNNADFPKPNGTRTSFSQRAIKRALSQGGDRLLKKLGLLDIDYLNIPICTAFGGSVPSTMKKYYADIGLLDVITLTLLAKRTDFPKSSQLFEYELTDSQNVDIGRDNLNRSRPIVLQRINSDGKIELNLGALHDLDIRNSNIGFRAAMSFHN